MAWVFIVGEEMISLKSISRYEAVDSIYSAYPKIDLNLLIRWKFGPLFCKQEKSRCLHNTESMGKSLAAEF